MKELGTLLALAGLVGIATSIALGLQDGPSALPFFLISTAICVALAVAGVGCGSAPDEADDSVRDQLKPALPVAFWRRRTGMI